MSSNMAAVSTKGDILAFIFALCIIFQVAQNQGGEEGGGLYERMLLETPTPWGQCGPVSTFEFLTLSKPLANYYGVQIYLTFLKEGVEEGLIEDERQLHLTWSDLHFEMTVLAAV